MKDTIYYFSGTGNSLKIAKDLKVYLGACELISIAKPVNDVATISPEGKVGFVFPIYYGGLPQIVASFMTQIDLSKASYVYVICVYGKTLGNMGGISQSKRIMKQKERDLDAAFYIKSVDNFILMTWDVPPQSQHPSIYEKAESKIKEAAKIIRHEKRYFDKSISEYIGPVFFRYKYFERTVLYTDQAFYAKPSCTSCGLCAQICPTQNLDFIEGKPVWKSISCQRCLACLHYCPVQSIQYGKKTEKRSRYYHPDISLMEMMRAGLPKVKNDCCSQ